MDKVGFWRPKGQTLVLPTMPSLAFSCPLPFHRVRLNFRSTVSPPKIHRASERRQHNYRFMIAVSKKSSPDVELGDSDNEGKTGGKKGSRRGRKKLAREVFDEMPTESSTSLDEGEKRSLEQAPSQETEDEKSKRWERVSHMFNLASSLLNSAEESEEEEEPDTQLKDRKKKKMKKFDLSKLPVLSDSRTKIRELFSTLITLDRESIVRDYDRDIISQAYTWPPLICCFGPAKHAFLPFARPADRIIDRKIHEVMPEILWSPDKFFRAPGGPASSVAVALAVLEARVEFMGSIGDDEFGKDLLYNLNVNGVQTRCVKVDYSNRTAVSRMKIVSGGARLSAECLVPCAEDCFEKSDIRMDILKEAEMFYFNSSALLDPKQRSLLMEAVQISKQSGGRIFFDVNLPLPLWSSREETESFLREAWVVSDFIELTKQELDFLCGFEPEPEFDSEIINDSKKADDSKFRHRQPEEILHLWHDSLKVLFVTNGTSRVHYYTAEEDGFVRGTEDVPIMPYTCDMSVCADAFIAALVKMLTFEPELVTDSDYLDSSIKKAIQCGLVDQWMLAQLCGYNPDARPDDDSENDEWRPTDDEEEEEDFEKLGELVS